MATRSPQDIGAEFNCVIRSLLRILEKKSRSEMELATLGRLGKRISLLITTSGPDALVAEAAPFFIEFSERILEKDAQRREQFFMSIDVRAEYMARGQVLDANDEFIISLVDSIKKHWRLGTANERDAAYADLKLLLKCSAEYQLATR
jgi:hypothetical protein